MIIDSVVLTYTENKENEELIEKLKKDCIDGKTVEVLGNNYIICSYGATPIPSFGKYEFLAKFTLQRLK